MSCYCLDSYPYSQNGEHYEPTQQFADTALWDASEIQRVIADKDAEYWNEYGLSMERVPGPPPRLPPSDLAGALGDSVSPLPPVSSAVLLTYPPERCRWLVPQLPWVGATSQYQEQEVGFEVQGGGGISLAQATSRHGIFRLVNGDEPWLPPNDQRFSDISSKISLRIHKCYPSSYTRQIMSLRATCSSTPIALREMARKIAYDTKKYLECCNHGGAFELQLDGQTYRPDEIFLYRLVRIGKGSWQPEYYIERR
ncbi:hypothetical protein FKP32DRAFT_1603116 [Trametes sanguinea]|nr:hypothetical protein FKP32DRAFT_1603116 [Trametes sanguinea]